MAQEFRIGQGFDMHRLRRGRKLILGGLEIPHKVGLWGHSDADVLLHAMINALLGAIGEGDIGTHFPDSEPRYKGIASTELLANVLRLVRRKKFTVVNADVTLIAQEPKLAPYFSDMKNNVADQLGIERARINIKATTTEKLGAIGERKAMAAMAVVLLRR
jgi:2-C-methyl-D-erythritol 2,4-cyclodiphosphate synthase